MSNSDSDDDPSNQNHRRGKSKAPVRSINELLKTALAEANQPGEGDEEPEILEAPGGGGFDITGKIESKPDEIELKEAEILRQKQLAIMEEEKKVAEMKFDADALLPCDRMDERAKYIPLRLTYEERKSLRLVCATINVSNYTNVVDSTFKSKMKRQHTQLQYIVAFLSGMIAALDYSKGQEVIQDRNFTDYEDIIQKNLEIARRYKITNPEKMRSEYGKLVYLMQDADSIEMKQLLGIEINTPIKTVYDILEHYGGLNMLRDSRIATATEEILPDKTKSRHIIQMEIKRKERAADALVKAYCSRSLSEDMIRLCLYSISDNNSFLNANLRPIHQCIELLKTYFHPDRVESGYSLSINEGTSGARLTHSHSVQYHYVLQSLTLWACIVEDMFRLWYLAELDLLSSDENDTSISTSNSSSSNTSNANSKSNGIHNSSSGSGSSSSSSQEKRNSSVSTPSSSSSYELRNTGQGLQRVKQSPRVYRAMHEILARTKQQLGGWIGSSVIHLGDNNVPNTLMFIDKYTQVPRILTPLIKTLSNLEAACEANEGLNRYMNSYGGINKAKKDILHDFFTHGFDGSGGDNFFDAGSCIDGRLTSAWHWCSQLSTKPYYSLFKLTGFLSFDGQFDN